MTFGAVNARKRIVNKQTMTADEKKVRRLKLEAERTNAKRRRAMEKIGFVLDRNRQMSIELTDLKDALRDFFEVQDRWLESVPQDAIIPGDWVRAYRRLKRLNAVTAFPEKKSNQSQVKP